MHFFQGLITSEWILIGHLGYSKLLCAVLKLFEINNGYLSSLSWYYIGRSRLLTIFLLLALHIVSKIFLKIVVIMIIREKLPLWLSFVEIFPHQISRIYWHILFAHLSNTKVLLLDFKKKLNLHLRDQFSIDSQFVI
jgi:hypothetical protein